MKSKRNQLLRRLLTVIDVMAPVRFGITVEEIHHEVCELTGQSWSQRTIHRDVRLLVEMNMAAVIDKRQFKRGAIARIVYRLNLAHTEPAQNAAIIAEWKA